MLALNRKSYLGPAEIKYMCDGLIETVECILVNIWYMHDGVWSQNCRNTLLLYTTVPLVRSAKNGTLFVYSTRIRYTPDGAISDGKQGRKEGYHSVVRFLREKAVVL